MKILALEFSSERRSVALLDSASGEIQGFASEGGGREMKALGMIQSVLEQSQSQKEAIRTLAIGLGPGSYTGIRAAISLAQGWQLACGVPLLGISSAEVLAKSAQMQSIQGSIHLIIDAQRNEFYTAKYDVSPGTIHSTEPLRLVSASEVQSLATANALLVGPDTRNFPTAKTIFPDARALALLARTRTDFLPGANLEPIYLREASFVKAPPPRVISE